MQFRNYLFLRQWIIFSILCDFIIAKAMTGENVREAENGEFTYVASIMWRVSQDSIEENTYHICTAVLVTQSHLLTASHCLENKTPNSTQVVIGAVSLKHGRVYYPLWFITYNEWAAFKRVRLRFRVNDIGVVKLSENVDSSIHPATISTMNHEQIYGLEVSIAGWGLLEFSYAPITMRTVKLQIISIEDCERRVEIAEGSKIPISDRHICSVAQPFALLQFGDSGGPLLYGDVVLGVNKATIPFPEQPNNPSKVNVHCGVIFYRTFIMETINSRFSWPYIPNE